MNLLEAYLDELRSIRSSGAAVPETSYYPALADLLNQVGKTLKPKVRCVSQLKSVGAGIPDFDLFSADQFQRASDLEPLPGPETGPRCNRGQGQRRRCLAGGPR